MLIDRSVHMNTPSSSPESKPGQATDSEVQRRYALIRAGVADVAPITVIHIGEERTVVATENGIEPPVVMVLAIGSRKTAHSFKHEPPTPGEMENAIMAVEDEVIRARTLVAGSRLFTTDPSIREIALIAGDTDEPELHLTLDAMERTFDRLASVVLGRPATREGIPASATFAATLLILREFMHHLQFASITIKR